LQEELNDKKKGRTNPLVMMLLLIVMFETTSPVSIEPYALFSMLHSGKESSRGLGYYLRKGSESGSNIKGDGEYNAGYDGREKKPNK
jgi:hypothetical protein